MRRFLVFLVVFVYPAVFALPLHAQSDSKSVEDEYLTGTVELQIIREYRSGNSLQSKETALDFADSYIELGNKGKGISDELTYIALEGTKNRLSSSGRLANNYPQIRARAVGLLAKIGTEEARRAIIDVMKADNEPNVVYAAMTALAEIGGENLSQSAAEASMVFNRIDAKVLPDNRVALGLLILCKKYIEAGGGKQRDNTILFLVQRLADSDNNHYNRWVREEAETLMKNYRASLASSKPSR